MRKLIIMRGIPGSGKSTVARETYPGATMCSADFYHMRPDPDNPGQEIYDWKPENMRAAHESCRVACREAMMRGDECVVIDNTNIKCRDYRAYVDMAEEYGYTVFAHEVRVLTADQLAVCVKRNLHTVPADTIVRMFDTFEQDRLCSRMTYDVMGGVDK